MLYGKAGPCKDWWTLCKLVDLLVQSDGSRNVHCPATSCNFLCCIQELTKLVKSASVSEGHRYQFHMLKAVAELKEQNVKLAMEDLELAALSEHSAGIEHGDILRLKAICWHKLERHDLSKECLYESSMVRLIVAAWPVKLEFASCNTTCAQVSSRMYRL